MSKNILSDFKSYNDYKNNVILPLNKKNVSKLKISKKFSKDDATIEEFSNIYKEKQTISNIQDKVDSNYEKKSYTQESYKSNIEDIRNKILAFANLSEQKKEVKDIEIPQSPTIPKIVISEVDVYENKLKPEELFSKLGTPSKETNVPNEIVKKIDTLNEGITTKNPQENNDLTEHQAWQKCTYINTEEAYIEYITTYPKGIYHIAADYRIKGIIKIY